MRERPSVDECPSITPLQARQYVTRWAAHELDHHAGNGSEWLFPDELTEADHARLVGALQNIVARLDREADRLKRLLLSAGQDVLP
jgi:hypothetical protein